MRKLLILILLFPITGFNQVYEKEKSKNDLKLEARDFQIVYSSATSKKLNSNNQYKLGNMYQAGYGVDVDIKEAVKWYKLAAQSGNENAMYSLGLIYERGLVDGKPNYREVDQKYIKETGWRSQSAYYFELGMGVIGNSQYLSDNSKREIFNFGVLLDERFESVSPDYKEAQRWYLAAIKENDRTYGARYRLGVMYYFGLGVERNYTIALNYFLKESNIAKNVLRKYLTFNKAQPDMPYLNFYIDSIVSFNIATMHLNGQGVKQDHKEALKWFEKSSRISLPINKLQFTPGLYQAGKMYYHGLGTKRNYKEARKFLAKAAALPGKDTRTSWILPDIKITKNKDIELFGEKRKATINAMVLLAHIYRNGYGMKKNKKNDQQALGWNYFAALSGHTQSIAILNTLGFKVPIRKGVSYGDYDDVFAVNASIPEIFDKNYGRDAKIEISIFEDAEATEFATEIDLIDTLEDAKSGDVQSQLKLAEYYSNDKNIRKNDVTAYAWLTIAADNGSLEAIKYRNAYQNRLSESQRLMAFEFARNVILSDNKKFKRKYEANESDRIKEEKKVVLAQLEIQKNTAINLVETEFEIKKEEELKKIDDAAEERERQAEKLSQENISAKDDESDDLGKALNKIENLYKKSLITAEERQLMRNKALGL